MSVPPARFEAHLGIVIVNYGSHDLIEANLASFDGALEAISIVVVDNFTTGANAASITALCARSGWTLIANEDNLGFGAAMNVGVGEARNLGAEVFLMLNPDATISASAATDLLDHVLAHPGTMVSPTIVRPDDSPWFTGGNMLMEHGTTTTRSGSDSSAPNGWLTGACIMVHHSLWAKIGGFDEEYFLYWEDVDLSWRCAAAGGNLRVARGIYATHAVGGTQRSKGKSPRYVFYNCRNRLLFAKKHLAARAQRRWLTSSVGYARSVVLRGGPRYFARDAVRLTLAAVLGTVSGVLILLRPRRL